MRKCLAALMILGWVSAGYAVMLADFETGLDGFVATGSPAPTLSLSTQPGAVTSGSQCLRVYHNGTNFWPLRWVAPSVPTRLGKLQIDITCFAADWPTQPWTRFCEKIALQSNAPGGGWVEYTTTTANWTNRLTGGPAPVDWGAWDGDMFRTVTIDISNYNLTGATYFQINLSFNCSTAGPYYIDAVRFLDEPHNPHPADNGVAVIGYDTELSWENATNSLNWVKVWFGAPVENPNDPNTILSPDTYKNLLTNIYTETNPGAASSCPMPSLTDGVKYTWVIESDPNTVPLAFWTFTASTNVPPTANAGADQYRWLGGQPSVVVTLNGSTSTDDGQPGPLSYLWEQTAGPAVTIANPNAAVTTVTLTELANTTEEGSAEPYIFQLTVNDGQFTSTDTVQVTLNTDSCRASIEAGGYYFYGDIAGPNGIGGNNRDCRVDLYDLAEVAVNWLGCSNIFEACN
ncbi:MAG TPA: hypothetical protein PKY88_06110 [Anaerohalosphaeraceae bacterium]|nr:hypothetical protein [Anaerohalosphaeraceae bacterium]